MGNSAFTVILKTNSLPVFNHCIFPCNLLLLCCWVGLQLGWIVLVFYLVYIKLDTVYKQCLFYSCSFAKPNTCICMNKIGGYYSFKISKSHL